MPLIPSWLWYVEPFMKMKLYENNILLDASLQRKRISPYRNHFASLKNIVLKCSFLHFILPFFWSVNTWEVQASSWPEADSPWSPCTGLSNFVFIICIIKPNNCCKHTQQLCTFQASQKHVLNIIKHSFLLRRDADLAIWNSIWS